MALFGKKEPCAICGGKVKALFPWKVDGHLICGSCHGYVDVPKEVEETMTLDQFKEYLVFRNENDVLRQQFEVTQKVDFGWLDNKFMFDMNHRFMCMSKSLETTIFEPVHVKSFVIREDNTPLFEGNAEGLTCYTSTVPERAMAMGPQINEMYLQAQMRETAERMRDMLDDDDNRTYRYAQMDIPEPFERFVVEIQMEHPYWSVFTADLNGPKFDNDMPNIDNYLRDYKNGVATVEELAKVLMEFAFPGAPVKQVAAATANVAGQSVVTQAAAVDAVEEIKKFKELLDAGIITQEEFDAKKRQLLGI